MKAFLTSLLVLAVITAVAAFSLSLVPMSARDVYTEHENVRL